MRIIHQNVRGLFSNLNSVKILLKNFEGIDILTFSETHINTNTYNDNSDLYSIPGYTFIRRNRKNGNCGGVKLYISDCVNWKRRDVLEHQNLECIWIEILLKHAKSSLVGTMHRPPAGSKYLPKDFETFLKRHAFNCYIRESGS